MFLSKCCVYAAWVAKGFLLKFRQKGFWQDRRETFDDNIVEEWYTRSTGWRKNEMAVLEELWDILLHSQHIILGTHACLGTLHLCRTQRMQYVIGIQIWYFCKNYVRNLVPDSNAEVLSHEQNLKTWKFWRTFRAWRQKNFGAHSELSIPHEQTSRHKKHHGINDTGNSNRHHCHKAQL